jgi:hypothetical protein
MEKFIGNGFNPEDKDLTYYSSFMEGIETSINATIEKAKETGHKVKFNYNGVSLVADATKKPEDILKSYNNEMEWLTGFIPDAIAIMASEEHSSKWKSAFGVE